MRIALAVPIVLALCGCQVSKGNNEVSVTYNQEVAENAASDVGNTAENIANDIGNDVKNTSEKVQNKVGNTDLNVKVNKDVKTENKSEKSK
jgi:hypothetical protein